MVYVTDGSRHGRVTSSNEANSKSSNDMRVRNIKGISNFLKKLLIFPPDVIVDHKQRPYTFE